MCRLGRIQDGAGTELRFGEGPAQFRMVVFRTGPNAWGYVNACPHFWLPLNFPPEKFPISGPGRVMRSHHSAIFRFEDGFCVDGPVKGGHLDPVPVEVVGDSVIICGFEGGSPSMES